MSKPYKTCPDCGDHLDPGEVCECKDKGASDTAKTAGTEAGQQVTGNPHGPVLVPGARKDATKPAASAGWTGTSANRQ